MSGPLSNTNSLLTAPAQNLSPEQDALRWRAILQRITDLENQLRNVVKFNDVAARGGSVISTETLNAGKVQILSPTNSTSLITLGSFNFGSSAFPLIQVPASAIQLVIVPQLLVDDNRDTPAPAFISICDEQSAFDAGLSLHTYSSISLHPGSTMPNDIFVGASQGGAGLGVGSFITRRAGIIWGAAGTWGLEVSFPFRYHGAPSSITLTNISQSLNGGTLTVGTIDYWGFAMQIAGSTGGGNTFNRWTASGGS